MGITRITSLVIVLTTATALAAFAQEGTLRDVKQGAKKAGETIKDGLETAGEKTKEAAETVGEKTKETAETVGKKTKETVETIGEKTKEGAKTAGHKTKKAVKKAKAEATGDRSTDRRRGTPSPGDCCGKKRSLVRTGFSGVAAVCLPRRSSAEVDDRRRIGLPFMSAARIERRWSPYLSDLLRPGE